MPNHSEESKIAAAPDSDALQAVREELLEKISANGNLPALGSSVSRVVQLASSDDEAVRSLAHFIMSDVGLTQKILRISNAACFRSHASNSPVTTISKAIFLLGFDTVKTCALGMLLVDRMPGSRAAGVRAELLHALSASMFGRELARRSQLKDAEEAAIAALFGNIGRLLVAAHDHTLYAEINALASEGMAPAKAAREVIGSSYETLAETVMTAWDMPDSIIQAQAPLPAGPVRSPRNRQEWIQQVAAFSNAAAKVLAQPDNPDAAIAALLGRFGAALNLDQARLGAMLATVAEETAAMASQLKLAPVAPATVAAPTPPEPDKTPSLWRALESDDGSLLGLPAEFLLQAAGDEDPLQTVGRHASGKPLNARELLLAGVQDVTEMMASGRCKANDLIMLVLETIYRGMGFRFATVCIKDIKSNQFRARISLGENNVARQAGFAFSATSSRDLFHLAMANEADLLISDATDAKIRDLIPAWHRALLPDARSFIVLPLVVQKKPLGLFYADRILPASEGVPPDETAMIKTLKGQVVAALSSR
ncbi:HDOD domain-containing protein [Janthinobacterium sp. 17J80-10]|uniref:HDOD domain-containing protein n=1 Tax=Janthinobacterium sp. 17J80-10 TaxID=2497863 RepID=UPI001F508EE0|nr:HDOD domain-containing protein [Janthinobacterium sp. 17J80-10]